MKRDLGRVVPILRDIYSAATSYEINDIVIHEGSLYWHIGMEKTTGVSPEDTTVWSKIFDGSAITANIQGLANQAAESATLAQASAIAAEESARRAEEAANG